jgi:hypothetical protein
MTDEGQPIKPEHVFKKVIWRSTLGLSESMEQATTWSITGLAAIIGLFISNLDSVGQLVNRQGLRWGLILFTASLVIGALSKQIGMAIVKGLAMLEKIENILSSEQGQVLMANMTTSPPQLVEEMAAPYLWPLSTLMRKSGRKGLSDYLVTDKRFIKLFCVQLLFVNLHGLLAAAGLVVVASSIITK